MKSFKKKFLSLILVIAMLITVVPTNVFATFTKNDNTVVTEESKPENNSNIDNQVQDKNENEEQKVETNHSNSMIGDESKKEDDKNQENTDDKENNKIDWPEKPNWIGKTPEAMGVPYLESGQNSSSFYAVPEDEFTQKDIDKAKEESANLDVEKGKEIQSEYFNLKLKVFINGKEYNGGDVSVKEGENFSYRLDWGPIKDETPEIESGDYFTKKLFTVKGLKFPNVEKKLVIDGINVGKMNLSYDSSTGEMVYTVTFTKYINMFDKDSVFAYFQGSSSFTSIENGNINIDIWGNTGNLTIEKNEKPTGPNIPSGEGWKPPMPPTYENSIRPFVKGVKWDNHGTEGSNDPQIEWRVVFLEKLQKKQREFLDNHPIETREGLVGKINQLIEDAKVLANNSINNLKMRANSNEKRTISEKGYCIVEDTLDENQVFNKSHTDLQNKYGGAPFYIELPVMLVGTNHILNRGDGPMDGAGDINGDGAGDIQTYFSGSNFREIVEGDNETKKNTVEDNPMTYAILKKDKKNKREKLIINVGKLGKEGEENLNWGQNEWPKEKLEKNINDCQNKIDQIITGQNSPISNLKTKYTELYNLLRKILNTSSDKVSEEDKEKIRDFEKDYNDKVTNKNLQNDAQIRENDIPSLEKLEALKGIIINENGEKLENNVKYANYKKSLKNLVSDQNIFLENRAKYTAEWEILKSKYERTLEFYNQDTGIYGFIVKIRSKVIKNSDTGFSNDVTISDVNSQYSAHKEHNIKFSGGIVGNFALGSVVLKKADSKIPESNNLNDLAKANGLKGAKFKVYCANENDEFVKDDEHLAHFIEKEASENGDAYTYTHTGNQPSGSIIGECKELEVNEDGTLILNKLDTHHAHYVVETVAPEGYYIDESPIKISAEKDKVTYKLVPNVQRAIGIRKIDSYSKKAIGGAEFELYKGKEKITNFKKKTVNGHTGYYIDKDGTDKLITSDDILSNKEDDKSPNLCIHGLDAGTYTLKEVKVPDGYENNLNGKEFTFTLPEEINKTVGSTEFDELNHIVKDVAIENDSKLDKLYFTKIDGNVPDTNNEKNNSNSENIVKKVINKIKENTNPNYDKNEKLEGAYFSIFKFKGNDEEWKNEEIRENTNNWEMIKFEEEKSKNYFTTEQEINDNFEESTRPGEIFKSVSAIKTDKNGNIKIENIPKGYYILTEVKAPDGYVSNLMPFYFKSGNLCENGGLKLYRNIGSNGELEDGFLYNKVLNFKRKLKLKLVKYDASGQKPKVEGDALIDYGNVEKDDIAYKYNSNVYNPNGIKGVKYKLFLNEGSKINPNPEEIKPENSEEIIGNNGGNYDICMARGETDDEGILDITEMVDAEGHKSFVNGIRMGKYYLVEVATSKEYTDGYILDQTPIQFNLDKGLFDIFKDPNDKEIGLLKMASNTKGESGIKIIKSNKEKKKLKDAEFIVKDNDGNYLYPTPIKDKENQYTLNTNKSDSNKLRKKVSKINTDFEGPSKDNPSKVENYNKIPDDAKIKSGKNGELILRGLTAGQEYQFVEIKAPIGYKIPDNNTFKAKAPKTREEEGVQKLEGDNLIYLTKEIENTELKGSLKVTKIDSNTRKELEGAVFSLYKKVPNKETVENQTEKDETIEKEEYELYEENLVTDEQGILTVDDLEWGKYYIQETKAPEGYVLDESKYHFIIDERSFNENGNSINIEIPYIENASKGAKRIKIVKTDENKTKLEGVTFRLEKRLELDDGTTKWIPYGKEEYVTNKEGEIDLVLPIGVYKLVEIGTVDGHILDTNEIMFEIEKGDKIEDPIEQIPVVNIKAATALYLKKTISYNGENTNQPLENVSFNFFDNNEGKNPLKFIEIEKGVYKYSENQNKEKLTTELVTNRHGEIRIALNDEFIGENQKKLYFKEVKAPGNIIVNETIHEAGMFKENEWQKQYITNELTTENRKVKIEVDKRDEDRKPLPGAEFTIFDKKGNKLASKTTELIDGSAIAEFTDDDIAGGFKLNEKYYIKETKAPEGFVKDESILKFSVDSESFVQDENGNWTMTPISFIAINSKVKGSLKLVKVDSENKNIPLKNAEFELFKKRECPVNGEIDEENNNGDMNQNNSDNQNDLDNENAENILTRMINKVKNILNLEDKENDNKYEDSTPETKPEEWVHYGETTYKTDENGEINLVLPSGEYYYIERKAPFGYETTSLKKGGFTIAKNQQDDENQQIEEKIVNVTNEKIPGKLGKVTLIKYNSSMQETLAGAGFKLFYKDNSDGKFKLVDNTLYTTDVNGKLTIDNLPPGEYYLLETVAPEGYQLPTDFKNRKHYFNIERDSKLTQNVLINVTNYKKGEEFEKGSMVLEKIDKDTKDKLKGAEFRLYYETKTTDGGKEFVPYEEKIFITGEDGRIVFNNLPIGKYYVEEIKAPEGYKLPEKNEDRKHYFEISRNDKELLNIILTVENSKNGTGGGTITPNPDPDKPVNPENPDKPTDPDKPVNPENPDKPTDPDKPVNPENPDKPTDPDKPVNPENPDKPTNPDKPVNPNDGGNSGGSSIISKLPKTGDTASIGFATVAFIGAGTGLVAIRRNNKKTITRSGRRSRRNRRKRRNKK